MTGNQSRTARFGLALASSALIIVLALSMAPGAVFAQDGGGNPTAQPTAPVFPDVPVEEDFASGQTGGTVNQASRAEEAENVLQARRAFELQKPLWLRKASQLAFKVNSYIINRDARGLDSDALRRAVEELNSAIAEADNGLSTVNLAGLPGFNALGQITDQARAQQTLTNITNSQRAFRVRIRTAYNHVLFLFNEARARDPLSGVVTAPQPAGGSSGGGGSVQPTATQPAPAEPTATPGAGGTVTPTPGAGGGTPSPTPGAGGVTPSPTPGAGEVTPTPGTGEVTPTPGTGEVTPTPGAGGETPTPGTPVAP